MLPVFMYAACMQRVAFPIPEKLLPMVLPKTAKALDFQGMPSAGISAHHGKLGSSYDGCEFIVGHVHCLTAAGIASVELRWLCHRRGRAGQWLQLHKK
jgi:hypothetical protein